MRFSSSPNRPSAWKEMKLADVCKTFTSGGTPSRKKPEYFENGTVPWVRTKELNDGVITEVEELITFEALKNSSAKILPKDSVLLAMYGATVGKLGVLGIESSCNQACAAMVPKDGIVDYRFLYYLLLNHRELIISQATGGAQQNLSGELIKGFTFDFPTFNEQEAISEVLWNLDEKIRVNNKVFKTLEELAQTIFKSWFIEFDPVKAKMAGIKPLGMSDYVAELFPDSMEDSGIGLIPKGWTYDSLSQHISVTKGKSYKSSELEESETALVTLKSFVRGGGYRFDGLKSFSGEYKPEQVVQPGELVVSFTDVTQAADVIGKPAIVLGNPQFVQLVASLDVGIVRPKSAQVGTYFLNQLFLTSIFNSHVRGYTNGTTVLHLGKGALEDFMFPLPSKRVLEAFEEFANSIFGQIQSLYLQNLNLQALRDSLLPRLISGELQIPEKMLA